MKERKHKSRILYSEKLPSNSEGEIKTFSDHKGKKNGIHDQQIFSTRHANKSSSGRRKMI